MVTQLFCDPYTPMTSFSNIDKTRYSWGILFLILLLYYFYSNITKIWMNFSKFPNFIKSNIRYNYLMCCITADVLKRVNVIWKNILLSLIAFWFCFSNYLCIL